MNKIIFLSFLFILAGCKPPSENLDENIISDKENADMEKYFIHLDESLLEKDSKDRIFESLYHQKKEIKEIADGNFHSNLETHVLMRKLAWITLSEIHNRYKEEQEPTIDNPNINEAE